MLVGRIWVPGVGGPAVVTVRDGVAYDIGESFPTMRALTEHPEPALSAREASGPAVGEVGDLLANASMDGDPAKPRLLSPLDLHVVKAAGVTFPVSMIERVIEERAGGDAGSADRIRETVLAALGADLSELVPGSEAAMRLKRTLVAEGMWSAYLEVGIGPDAEVFTKAPVLSTVGSGAEVGVRGDSEWNNPEPEVVLVVSSAGRAVGAALGNDVNLRDIEGRSALLLGQAKDNNGSAAVGPFIRLFDGGFGIEELRQEVVTLHVSGDDGFELEATSPLAAISRDPLDLVGQTIGARHQYPDGFALYLGTMFAPTKDRDQPGMGFTHHPDDVVRISSPRLGSLVNWVRRSEDLPPWTFGVGALMANLAERGLLRGR
ncbi:fumarylacetoacetate hydrolase family protein [Homoserinibacter sp. GY 40078]|nr:fumarylacetoacetate hydrolase family protein [Homoserinibacter sp. GY 40078]